MFGSKKHRQNNTKSFQIHLCLFRASNKMVSCDCCNLADWAPGPSRERLWVKRLAINDFGLALWECWWACSRRFTYFYFMKHSGKETLVLEVCNLGSDSGKTKRTVAVQRRTNPGFNGFNWGVPSDLSRNLPESNIAQLKAQEFSSLENWQNWNKSE